MGNKLSVFAGLIKYRLSIAVVFSSVAGYYLSGNNTGLSLFYLSSGVFFLASGSAVLNQYTERIADSVMERTRNRPIPSKRISEKHALKIAVILLLTGCFFLYMNGPAPLLLGILNVVLYNLIYTSLKKKTILSIVPGALVGAIPPWIGFFSGEGTFPNQNIIAFSIFMFLWQLPHFWLIIIKYDKEYRIAGFATLTKYLHEIQIRYLVFFWVLLSTFFLFFFFFLAETFDKNIFASATIINLAFIFFFYRLLFIKKKEQEIKGAFLLINSFSFLIMFLIIAVAILRGF